MKNLFSKIKSKFSFLKSKPNYNKEQISPKKDWLYIICFFVTSVLIVGLVSFIFYLKVQNGSFWKNMKDGQSKVFKLNNVNLSNVLNHFKSKEEKSNLIKNDRTILIDPFL